MRPYASGQSSSGSRFCGQPNSTARRLVSLHIPPELPAPIPLNTNLQYKKKKGNTRKSALTGAEAAERQERVIQARARAQARAEVAETSIRTRQQARRHLAAEIVEGQGA